MSLRCVWVSLVLLLLSIDSLSHAQTVHASDVFENKSLFEIKAEAKESDWESCGDAEGDRRERTTRYTFYLTNNSSNDLNGITGSYCLYRDRNEYVEIDMYELPAIGPVDAGKTVEYDALHNHASYKRTSPRKFLNEVVGMRARFVMKAADGTELVREVSVPDGLSEKKYPWKQTADSLDLPDPSGYPDKEMTDKDVKALVKQYIKAVEREDFEAWKELLAPMHSGDEYLDKDRFMSAASKTRSIDIDDIDGRNVVLEIVSASNGRKRIGYLQIDSSGHIKYTPFVFIHPIHRAFNYIGLLEMDDVTWRNTGVTFIKKMDIPLFGYDAQSSKEEYSAATSKILDWLTKNGQLYDTSDPKIYISQREFNECVDQAVKRRNAPYKIY
jgi:hypothetical protein